MNQKNCNLLLFKSHMLVRNALNFHLSSLQFFFSPDIFFCCGKNHAQWTLTAYFEVSFSNVSCESRYQSAYPSREFSTLFSIGLVWVWIFFHTLSIVSGCKLNGLSTPNEKWLLKSRPSMKDVWFNFISPTPSDKINRTGVKLIT